MMLRRLSVLVGALLGAGALAVPAVGAQGDPTDVAAQEEAAELVMEQLEASDSPMSMDEIDTLDQLGPAPWLSFMPGRSDKVIEAWTEVAQQLPEGDMNARRRPPGGSDPSRVSESEDPGEVGGNDTPETGDRILRFGTGRRQSRLVTIEGNLSGSIDCRSAEDDGSITTANPPSVEVGDIAFCAGEIGDGPYGTTTGDTDFYALGQAGAGDLLVLDVDHVSETDRPVATVLGIYDSAGTLVASAPDAGGAGQVEFLVFEVVEAGEYFGVIAGAGDLPSDPFDPASGAGVTETGTYEVFVGVLPSLAPEAAEAALDEAAAEAREAVENAPVDVDVFLVRLRVGDAISGGFDAAQVAGIIDPAGVGRHVSPFNPSFIYPADSPLRHERRVGFDHVATVSGTHAVFVTEGNGPYEGELRIARAGLADQRSAAQQTIFLDFDGAAVSPSIFGPPSPTPIPPQDLSPLASFLPDWGLTADDEDAVIDATIDAVIENLDTDLRILDGRNGDRDATGNRREFDIEILNSRDHGDRWGDANVSRIVIGGTIDQLQIPTIGIAQSIDPGNQETEETGVVLLDLLSAPAPSPVSLNSYGVAPGFTKSDLVGYAVGHIAAHEVGHYIGNWHTETFNPQVSLMDAGGEFLSIFGVGADGVFGTGDDVDADFAEDVFNSNEGFAGLEDTAGRSVFALSTGNGRPPRPDRPAVIGDMVTSGDGTPEPRVAIDLFTADEDGTRLSYVRTTKTDRNGQYRFRVDPGCYALVFIAPPGRTFVGGDVWDERSGCFAAGDVVVDFDARLNVADPSAQSSIGDQVTFESGTPVSGVAVDLFAAEADGSRGRFIAATTTDDDGTYGFTVGSGCYVVVFVAPDGSSFVGGSPWSEHLVCLDEGASIDTIDAVLEGSPA